MIKHPLLMMATILTSLTAMVDVARGQLRPETVEDSFATHIKYYKSGEVYVNKSLSPESKSLLDQKFKRGFVADGLGTSKKACAFMAFVRFGYLDAGNWVKITNGSLTYDIAPKAMFANGAKWDNTTDGKSTAGRTGRQILRVFDKGKKWRVNWALGAGEYIKSYPMMAYNLKSPIYISGNLKARKLASRWNFQFGYPRNSSGTVDSSKMDYNVMHELYFKGTASSADATRSVRVQVELAQSKNHSTSEIRRVRINGSTWVIGFFQNTAANQFIWQFTRPKTTYYRKIGTKYYPPYSCSTSVDIFPLLQWLKDNPNIAKVKNSRNPSFPTSLQFHRVETGIEIVRGLDGSCFQSDFYSMSEQ